MKFASSSYGSIFSFLLACTAGAETIYFLLGPHPYPGAEILQERLGSAVIPLSDPAHIAHARDLIVRGPVVGGEPNSPLAGMRIRAGKNGINRNYYDPTLPEWSWHPYVVLGFGDGAAAGDTTSPKLLEATYDWSDPAAWNERRPVYFGHLTVVREFGPRPVFLSTFVEGDALQFYWTTLDANSISYYTLESTPSLLSPNWQPFPGEWPKQTNRWTLERVTNTDAFYRVKAIVE